MSVNGNIDFVATFPAGFENISNKSLFSFNNFVAKYHSVVEILRVLLMLVLGWTGCDVGRNFHSF